MKTVTRIVLFILIIGGACFLLLTTSSEEHQHFETHFNFQIDITVPGSPDEIFDLVTGDISEWWDYTFSDNPKALFIEPKPGGGFWEIFDENGNGARHAEVIYADRGKFLRMEGPLELSGQAIHMVMTYQFESIIKDSTKLTLTVDASGHFEHGTPQIVEKVWHDFLVERFAPYVNRHEKQKLMK